MIKIVNFYKMNGQNATQRFDLALECEVLEINYSGSATYQEDIDPEERFLKSKKNSFNFDYSLNNDNPVVSKSKNLSLSDTVELKKNGTNIQFNNNLVTYLVESNLAYIDPPRLEILCNLIGRGRSNESIEQVQKLALGNLNEPSLNTLIVGVFHQRGVGKQVTDVLLGLGFVEEVSISYGESVDDSYKAEVRFVLQDVRSEEGIEDYLDMPKLKQWLSGKKKNSGETGMIRGRPSKGNSTVEEGKGKGK